MFKHPGIRKALGEGVVYEKFSSLSLLHTMACFMDSGVYPEGGSLALGKRMEDKIKALGGKIVFNTKVDKVVFEDDVDGIGTRDWGLGTRDSGIGYEDSGHRTRKAGKERYSNCCGVEISGEKILYDAVIVSQDLLTCENLLGKYLNDKWIKAAADDPPVQTTFAAIGVREDLRSMPYAFAFDEKINIGGIEYDDITLTNYAEHTSYAPPGCSALTCMFTGDNYDYWKKQKENGTYEQVKQELAENLRCIIEKHMPHLIDKIEVINIATPLTYERYAGSFKGAWMTVLLKQKIPSLPKCKSAAYERLYFVGFRTKAPGGLPIAMLSGYKAAQHICRDFGMVFESLA